MKMAPWLYWLIPICFLLMLFIMIFFFTSNLINRERKRHRLHRKLLENYIEELQVKIAKLENQLKKVTPLQSTNATDNNITNKKVFLSYSSKDYSIVKALQQLLMQKGISCFMAPESIPPGSNYTQEIPNAICDCFAMVVVLSSTSQNSQWVAKEVDMALEENIPIIPYHIDRSKPNRQFRFMLGQCQYIQVLDEPESANKELICRLKALQATVNDNKN